MNRTRRNTIWAASTASALALLFSYQSSLASDTPTLGSGIAPLPSSPAVSAPRAGATTGAGAVTKTPGAGAATKGGTAATKTPVAPAAPVAPVAPKTYSGTTVDTRYGPVQVQAVVTAGKITSIDAIQRPSGGQSSQINDYAVPILNQQALTKQSSRIDGVSGATYTSAGYASSLQSIIDAAHL